MRLARLGSILLLAAACGCIPAPVEQPLAPIPPTKPSPGEGFDVEVLVFKASWCGPCRQMEPILERVQTKLPHVKFRTIDIDENRALATKYKVNGIPHFVVQVEGRAMAQKSGGMSETAMIDFVRKAIPDVQPAKKAGTGQ